MIDVIITAESQKGESAEKLADNPKSSNFNGSASCMTSQCQGANRRVGICHFQRHEAALR